MKQLRETLAREIATLHRRVGAENNQFKELTIDTQGYLQTSTTLLRDHPKKNRRLDPRQGLVSQLPVFTG